MTVQNASLARIAVLMGVTCLGFYSKFHRGLAEGWINNSLGGILYVVFWVMIWNLVRPRHDPRIIAISVFLLTSGLEILQLSRHPVLEWGRSFFIGRTLLGTTFVASDFFYYMVGGLLGYGWLQLVQGLNPWHSSIRSGSDLNGACPPEQ